MNAPGTSVLVHICCPDNRVVRGKYGMAVVGPGLWEGGLHIWGGLGGGGTLKGGASYMGGSWGGDFERGYLEDGRSMQWMHGLGPCTASFFGSPPPQKKSS
jgi:hypothetical protein